MPAWGPDPDAVSATRDRIVAEATEQFIQLRFDHRLALDLDALQDFDTGQPSMW